MLCVATDTFDIVTNEVFTGKFSNYYTKEETIDLFIYWIFFVSNEDEDRLS